jgi:hypothetical protein
MAAGGHPIGQPRAAWGSPSSPAGASADSARVWGIAVVATAVAGLGYALIALAGRVLTPWASASQRSEP